jgi:hypothetical protein
MTATRRACTGLAASFRRCFGAAYFFSSACLSIEIVSGDWLSASLTMFKTSSP